MYEKTRRNLIKKVGFFFCIRVLVYWNDLSIWCGSGEHEEDSVYSNYEEKETIYTQGRCWKLRGNKGGYVTGTGGSSTTETGTRIG